MTLRTRLALSHLSVVLLFLLVFAATFFFLASPTLPGNRLMIHRLKSILAQGDLDQLPALGLSPSASLDLYRPNQPPDHLYGPVEDRSTPVPEGLWSGDETAQFSAQQGAVFWFPVQRGEEVVAVARLGGLHNREELRDGMLRGFLAACLAAIFCSLLFAWWVSDSLSRPARQLAEAAEQLGEGDLQARAKPSGPAEMVELANSFNEMGERLQQSVSQLRQAKDKAERSEASRRTFLGDVSHNLRTPLAAILGWTEALLEGMDPLEQRKTLIRLSREANFVSRTVARLLDLSRWEEADPVLMLESVPLSEPLIEVADTLSETAEEKGVELEFIGLDPTLHVQADRHRLRELVQILLENVVDHAGSQIQVSVSVKPGPDRVQLVIEDNGCGFEVSEEQGPSFGRDHGRASLGLAIARRLAQAHGSSLDLTSQIGQGTRVSFSLSTTGS